MVPVSHSGPTSGAPSEVETVLLELVSREFGRTAHAGDRLSALGVDSIALAEFLGVIEERFKIEADAEILDVDTLEELVRYVEARR